MKYRVNTALQSALVIADVLLLWVSLWLSGFRSGQGGAGGASGVSGALEPVGREWALYLAVGGVWAAAALTFGTYRAVRNRLAYQELTHILKALGASAVALAGMLYVSMDSLTPVRYWTFVALSLVQLSAFRVLLRFAYRRVFHRTWGSAMIAPARVVVIGEGSVLYDTLCTLSKCDPKEVALVGYLDCQEDLARELNEAVEVARPRVTKVMAAATSTVTPTAHTYAESRTAAVGKNGKNGHVRGNGSAPAVPVAVIEPLHTAASARAAMRETEELARAARSREAHDGEESASLDAARPDGSPLGHEIEKMVAEKRADNVVVAMSRGHHHLLSRLVAELQRLPVHIVLVPDVADLTILSVGVTELGDAPALKLRAPVLSDMQLALKRAMDLALVVALMPILLPLMGLVALAIKLDSPGPVVFRQRRIGQYGRPFTMYKFRTMVQDAETRLREVTTYSTDGKPLFKNDSGDPRITRVGSVLRRLSLDELPQLFNVLLGQMSLVGPRPELPRYVNYYDTWQHFRLWVPPGITGWWQIKGREKQPMYLHWDDDIYYIKNYSLLLDMQILWMTLASAVVGGTGR